VKVLGILRPRHALRGLVKVYQAVHPAFFQGSCRFHPTCSHYSLEALQKHGSLRGTVLTAWRIWRCQPLYPAGYDPVPEAGMGFRAALGASRVLGAGPLRRLYRWIFSFTHNPAL
jgi:uncharacterized protein